MAFARNAAIINVPNAIKYSFSLLSLVRRENRNKPWASMISRKPRVA